MALTALLCTDGSELAHHALVAGLAVVAPPDRVVIVTVVDVADPTLVVGTGMAGGVMTPIEAAQDQEVRMSSAQAELEAARTALGLDGAETEILVGAAGPAICDFAATLPASVVVLGTSGRSGLKRAVLGSVSDHVVRNAPCPVVTTGPE